MGAGGIIESRYWSDTELVMPIAIEDPSGIGIEGKIVRAVVRRVSDSALIADIVEGVTAGIIRTDSLNFTVRLLNDKRLAILNGAAEGSAYMQLYALATATDPEPQSLGDQRVRIVVIEGNTP